MRRERQTSAAVPKSKRCRWDSAVVGQCCGALDKHQCSATGDWTSAGIKGTGGYCGWYRGQWCRGPTMSSDGSNVGRDSASGDSDSSDENR